MLSANHDLKRNPRAMEAISAIATRSTLILFTIDQEFFAALLKGIDGLSGEKARMPFSYYCGHHLESFKRA